MNVEVAVSSGIPGISIVGMGDVAVQEARERVRMAIRSSGFSMPPVKIVVNLAPGNMRKTGSGFDLPIAVGILVATGQLPPSILQDTLLVGELSLDGELREVPGELAYGMLAMSEGLSLVVPYGAEPRIPGLDVIRLRGLSSMVADGALEGSVWKEPVRSYGCSGSDLADVAGHEVAKRAIQIAAAGSHGMLLCGPPGAGKTMLASRVPSVLPLMSEHEALETAVIHSVASEPVDRVSLGERPFRNPHHSATSAGMLGGGNPIRPGEVTLAHNGVLFLDELAEFSPSVLQGLRQPMESGMVRVIRAHGGVTMPARFMLVAATNPCPCGYHGDDAHECRCTAAQIDKYQNRVGGPLMDRIRIQVDVRRGDSGTMLGSAAGTTSSELREGVMMAREFASWRAEDAAASPTEVAGTLLGAGHGNRPMTKLEEAVIGCRLDREARRFLEDAIDAERMSGRSVMGVLGVSRTIADIEQHEEVGLADVAEAMGFRVSEMFGGA